MEKIGKTAGIICEYNPFHNGHKYQIEQTKKATGCEYTVCAMSGSMVQRGDVAVFDKWTRCRGALEGGADLVIELPAYYVLQSAQNFAFGGVELLSQLGVVDVLSFGSETADMDMLNRVAGMISDEPEGFAECIEGYLSSGMGYPAAYQAALEKYLGITLKPNDTLAVNYISAIKRSDSLLMPFTLKRDTDYHAECTSGDASASATAVRELLYAGKDISSYVPVRYESGIYDIRNAESLILGFFRLCTPDRLRGIIGIEPGLENRLISCAREASTFEEFISAAVTKRYTAHRIRRVVMSAILGLIPGKKCDYVRVLGFSGKGRELLSEIKEKSPLTLVTKTADFRPSCDSTFAYDILATDIASLCAKNPEMRRAGLDYTTSPVVIK